MDKTVLVFLAAALMIGLAWAQVGADPGTSEDLETSASDVRYVASASPFSKYRTRTVRSYAPSYYVKSVPSYVKSSPSYYVKSYSRPVYRSYSAPAYRYYDDDDYAVRRVVSTPSYSYYRPAVAYSRPATVYYRPESYRSYEYYVDC